MARKCLNRLAAIGRARSCLAALTLAALTVAALWLGPASAQPLGAATPPAAPAAAALTPRRLILCLDGTSNNDFSKQRREAGTDVLKPTNVLKTCRAVVPWDAQAQREQISYYDTGVGSLSEFPGTANHLLYLSDRLLGGAWGAGFERNVERALGFLALNLQPSDEVFLFGFSRGAATARGVTRFVDWAGGLPVKGDAYYLPILFREFIRTRGQVPIEQVLLTINGLPGTEKRTHLGPLQPVQVRYLGVWDTVMALGSRFRATGAHTTGASKSFYLDDQPDRCVKSARQALAVDEARFDFRPEVWTGARPGQTLAQRWFAGVHSNIGGGYANDGLANLAFHWILEGAEEEGLAVDPQYVKHFSGFPFDRLYRSESALYRVLDRLRGRYGRGKRPLLGWPTTANLSLDPSVIYRLAADPKATKPGASSGDLRFPRLETYRPRNVIAFLACQPNLDDYLRGLGIADDNRQLPADVMSAIQQLRKDCPKT
ncbi:MAG TPA: DUF2235 domain-containing protein [Thermoanaerobaculia bacterium]|jgi:uncharacterized protein (DUF2235 family)|nr:DUF2235 domain-containing protein [Thermoanaerobaculia bacterium]